jgi:uncharacterized protein (TIGR02268 family)
MPLPLSIPLWLPLLALPTGTEYLHVPDCSQPHARVELNAAVSRPLVLVCLSPGRVSHLAFKAPLNPRSFHLEEARRFTAVRVDAKGITFLLPEDYPVGKRLWGRMCFAEGAPPTCVDLLLVGHEARHLYQLEVYRPSEAEWALRQEVLKQEARAAHSEAEGAKWRVLAERTSGFPGLLFPGLKLLDSRQLSRDISQARGSLWGKRSFLHRAAVLGPGLDVTGEERWALEVEVVNLGPRPWMAAEALLLGPQGEQMEVRSVWQLEPIAQGRMRSVLVEVEPLQAGASRGPYTLILWDGEKTFPVVLGDVSF